MTDLVGNRFIGLVLGSVIGLIGAALIAEAIVLFKGEKSLLLQKKDIRRVKRL